MSALIWGIKASLIAYISNMPDGTVECSDNVGMSEEGFMFPGVGLTFTGSVVLTGHSGMLHLVFANPAIHEVAGECMLSIADPDDPRLRLELAAFQAFDGRRGTSGTLTEAGADLFFGPYEQGTPVADFTVTD